MTTGHFKHSIQTRTQRSAAIKLYALSAIWSQQQILFPEEIFSDSFALDDCETLNLLTLTLCFHVPHEAVY